MYRFGLAVILSRLAIFSSFPFARSRRNCFCLMLVGVIHAVLFCALCCTIFDCYAKPHKASATTSKKTNYSSLKRHKPVQTLKKSKQKSFQSNAIAASTQNNRTKQHSVKALISKNNSRKSPRKEQQLQAKHLKKRRLRRHRSKLLSDQYKPELAAPVHHQTEQSPLPLLTKAIHSIVQKNGKRAQVALKVVELHSEKCLYQKDAGMHLVPASNTKLFTSAAALHILGPDFTFKTRLFTDRFVSKIRINNLYIEGSGDPALTDADLESLIHQLQAAGIREIKGNIVINNALFDQSYSAPGWTKGDGPIFDKAPADALMVNHSVINIVVRPSRIESSRPTGQRPYVVLDPYNNTLGLENKAQNSAQETKKNTLHVSLTPTNAIKITGVIKRHSKPHYYTIAASDPALYTAQVLLSLLKQHKIYFFGKIVVGTVPQGAKLAAKLVATHESAPLSKLVRHMLKHSDNLYADAFFKRMGAEKYGIGTWATGKKAVESFLRKSLGESARTVELFDGSGLSHSNRISPNQLINLLLWMYKQSPHRDIFVDALPISGMDGTLRRRMRHKITHKKIQAKTGNLTGVTSLAGYILSPKKPLIFVTMVNRKNKSVVGFKSTLEDTVCTLLAAHAFSGSSL